MPVPWRLDLQAGRDFDRLPAPIQVQFSRRIRSIARRPPVSDDPEVYVHQLRGSVRLWTLHVGEYRGIFSWDGVVIVFVGFGRNPEIYKRFG